MTESYNMCSPYTQIAPDKCDLALPHFWSAIYSVINHTDELWHTDTRKKKQKKKNVKSEIFTEIQPHPCRAE